MLILLVPNELRFIKFLKDIYIHDVLAITAIVHNKMMLEDNLCLKHRADMQ